MDLALSLLLVLVAGAGTLPIEPDLPPEVVPFVPDGFAYEKWVKGDLTGDGLEDLALVLVAAAEPDPTSDGRSRRLLVLAATPDGKFRLLGSSDRLLRCDGCFGVMMGLPHLRIEKGVLVVEQVGGSRESWGGVWRFRLDPATGRLRLIGLDQEARDRVTGAARTRSTNLLTGTRVDEMVRPHRRIARTVSKSPVEPAFLEDARSDVLNELQAPSEP